jgi:hypothetical protein
MEVIHEYVSHMLRFTRFLSIAHNLKQLGEQDEEMNHYQITLLSLHTPLINPYSS